MIARRMKQGLFAAAVIGAGVAIARFLRGGGANAIAQKAHDVMAGGSGGGGPGRRSKDAAADELRTSGTEPRMGSPGAPGSPIQNRSGQAEASGTLPRTPPMPSTPTAGATPRQTHFEPGGPIRSRPADVETRTPGTSSEPGAVTPTYKPYTTPRH
jgi:hypothetical protein